MFKKKKDNGDILQDAIYGTGGIPKPEVGAETISYKKPDRKNRMRNMFSKKKVKEEKSTKKPNFFQKIFSKPGFKRRKGIDGF